MPTNLADLECVLPHISAAIAMKRVVALALVNKAFASTLKDSIRNLRASIIQRFWRWCRRFATTKVLAARFAFAQLDDMRTFETFIKHVRAPATVSRTKKFLARIVRDTPNVKIFLSAYPIMYYPHNIFEQFNAREQALFESTRPLLENFRAIVADPYARRARFGELLNAYIVAFDEWRVPDALKNTNRIKHAIRALMQARLNVLPEDVVVIAEFATHLAHLAQKMVEINGRAALIAFQEELEGEMAYEMFAALSLD